jgi:hypothetical protein
MTLCTDAYLPYCKENSKVVHVLKYHKIKMHDRLVLKNNTFLTSTPGVGVAYPCPVRDEDISGQCSMQPSPTTTSIIDAKEKEFVGGMFGSTKYKQVRK